MTADPYAHSTLHGKPLDNATIAAIKAMEAMLGYELTITQGIGGAAASSGTHLDGRAVDLAPFDYKRKLRAGLACGFIGWHRPRIFGLWPEHVHMVLVLGSRDNARGIAPAAFRQIAAYFRRTDGLRSDRPDSSTHPDLLVPFVYPPQGEPVSPFKNNVTEARDLLTEAAHALGMAAAKLEGTPKKRAVVHAQALACRAARRTVNGILHILPPK